MVTRFVHGPSCCSLAVDTESVILSAVATVDNQEFPSTTTHNNWHSFVGLRALALEMCRYLRDPFAVLNTVLDPCGR
jgi:hypothetical protein